MKVVPLPGPALSAVDAAAVQLDDALDDGQAEPGRAFAGGRLGRQALEPAEQADMSSGDRPGPLSRHLDQRLVALVARPRSSMRPPTGEYLMALLTRLSIASRRRSGSPLTRRASGAFDLDRLLLRSGERPAGLDDLPHQGGEVDRLGPDA